MAAWDLSQQRSSEPDKPRRVFGSITENHDTGILGVAAEKQEPASEPEKPKRVIGLPSRLENKDKHWSLLDLSREDLPPDLVPIGAELKATSAAHSRVRMIGLGRHFPASSVNVRNAQCVQVGDDNTVHQEDHYHVKRAVISTDGLNQVRAEIAELVAGERSVRSFQNALKEVRSRQEHHETVASKPVTGGADTTVRSSKSVQVGNRTSHEAYSGYVVDVTTLPLIDLLAENEGLVRSFTKALKEDEPGHATAGFMRDAWRAGEGTDDLDLLGYSTGVDKVPDALLFGFFGSAKVNRAEAVLIGRGNTIEKMTGVDLPKPVLHDLVADLANIREDIGLTPEEPANIGRSQVDEVLESLRTESPLLQDRIDRHLDEPRSPDRGLDIPGPGGL